MGPKSRLSLSLRTPGTRWLLRFIPPFLANSVHCKPLIGMNSKIFSAIQSRQICFRFYHFLSSKGTHPSSNLKACVALLQSYAQNRELSEGRKVHSHMIVSGQLRSPVAVNGLINMYSKCSSVSDAISVFNSSTDVHNVFVYNSIVAGLTANNLASEAFEFYRKMRSFGIEPDKFTFPCAIKACSDASDLRNIHGLLIKFELNFDEFVGSALLNRYLRFELMDDAQKVFEGLSVKDYDVVLWNAMISGFVQIGELSKAMAIFKRMVEIGLVPSTFCITGVLSALAVAADFENGRMVHSFAVKMGYVDEVEVSNALIDMYGKCKKLEDALMVFDNMIEKDMYSWNTVVTVHQQCGDYEGTLRFLKTMISSGFQPDLVTLTSALPACSHLSGLVQGKEIHGYMIRKGLENLHYSKIANSLMDMYAKCGSIRQARNVFDGTKHKDVASWNIMVMCYGVSGSGEEALSMFYRMRECGLKPDAVSFVGVLTACVHGGFLSRGQRILEEMETRYGVKPKIQHYACVVDMLGRRGKLREAFEMISNMPIEPNQVVWRSFLAACQLHGNAELGRIAAEKALELDPDYCGSYVLMSNVYGAAGRYEEVEEVRSAMREKEVSKTPGCSWIGLSDGMRLFFNGDRGFLDERFVYNGLDSLTASMRGHGFVVDGVESSV